MDADREVDLTLQKSNWKVLHQVKNGRKEETDKKKKREKFYFIRRNFSEHLVKSMTKC